MNSTKFWFYMINHSISKNHPFLLVQSTYLAVSQGFPERKNQQEKHTHTELYFKQLTHAIMEFESKGSLLVELLLLQGGLAFAPFRTSTDWMRFTHIREDHLFYSKSTNLNVNLIEKHPHRNIPKYHLTTFLGILAQPHGNVTLAITII